jgi:pilus assembly protein CpaE
MQQRPLRLAIITDDPYRADAVEEAAAGHQWQLQKCIGQVHPLEWLRQRQVDLVLVDLDTLASISLLAELSNAMPTTPLLALATPKHLVDLQNALLAGAANFVAFPIEREQFTNTVLRAVQASAPKGADSKVGRLIAFVGLKGGVGRSTLAVNLAIALHQRKAADVILIEAHQGLGDLSLMLNLLPKHTLAGLNQEVNIDVDIIQGHLHGHDSGVRLLAAPSDLTQLVELPIETWRHIFKMTITLAPFVVVDTAASADPILSEVLTQADDIFVVTGPDLTSLRSAVMLLRILDDETNVRDRVHVVLNRAGVRGGVSEAASSAQLGEKIAVAIPDDLSLATFALNRGVPFVLSHPRALLSRCIHDLVDLLFDKQPISAHSKTQSQRQRLSVPFLHRR